MTSMVTISISESTYKRFASIAKPFATETDVLNGLLDLHQKLDNIQKSRERTEFVQTENAFSLFNPPDLKHTRLLHVDFLGKRFNKLNWTVLLYSVIIEAKRAFPDSYKDLILHNYVNGIETENGYHYVEELGISIQSLDSNGTFKTIRNIITKLNSKIYIKFEWMEKGLNPGLKGVIKSDNY